MTHILAMVWHSIQVHLNDPTPQHSIPDTSPSIGLDGEPEKRPDNKRVCFGAARTPIDHYNPQYSIPDTSPSIGLGGKPETTKEFAVKQG